MSGEDVAESTAAQTDLLGRVRPRMVVAGAVMGLVVGGFAAWTTANVGLSEPAFLVAFLGGSYYVYRKESPSQAVGSGLYITAVLMALAPVVFFLDNVLGAEPTTVPATGLTIGSATGLILWGFAFLFAGLVVGSIGCYFKTRPPELLQ